MIQIPKSELGTLPTLCQGFDKIQKERRSKVNMEKYSIWEKKRIGIKCLPFIFKNLAILEKVRRAVDM